MPTPHASHHTPHQDPRDRLLAVLTCPVCSARLERFGGALRCADRHTFDIARQGYVSLLTGRPASADTAAMVRARTAFLGAGHYAPLARSLAGLAPAFCPPDGTVLDAGTGTGHHLATVLDSLPSGVGLGLDTSTFALRSAARAHPRALAARWDVWRPLPLRAASTDLVLNVFAPRSAPEFHRVLRPGGHLLVVTPTDCHLHELRDAVGTLTVAPDKSEKLRTALSGHFRQVHAERQEHTLTLTRQDVADLVSMGPSAHHVAPAELHRRIGLLSAPVRVTASFALSVHRHV